jgi:NADPH:quinone reductase-like Zn-dependent oxidoreductase
MAGQVEAVGKDVKQFQPGDEVFGWCSGALAEYVSVSEDNMALKPLSRSLKAFSPATEHCHAARW